MLNRAITVTVSMIGIGLLVWFGKGLFDEETAAAAPAPMPPKVVQTILAKNATIFDTLKTVASLEAKNIVDIRTTLHNSTVEKILADSGAKVKKNDVLVTFVPQLSLKAPFDGYLTKWKVKPGAFISQQGTTLVQLLDKNKLTLDYYIPEQYAAKLRLGQMVKIKVRAFPDSTFEGKLSFISPIVESTNHSILVRAELQNVDDKLLPGTFVQVEHYFEEEPTAVLVPDSSLIQSLEGYSLFKVVDNKLVKKNVTLGARKAGRTQILTGVVAGDQVLLTLSPGLMDGATVKAVDWQGDW